MASQADQDLLPEQTEGFKVAEKKTIDEYKNMGEYRSLSVSFDKNMSSLRAAL
jgi:hypothetical protein